MTLEVFLAYIGFKSKKIVSNIEKSSLNLYTFHFNRILIQLKFTFFIAVRNAESISGLLHLITYYSAHGVNT